MPEGAPVAAAARRIAAVLEYDGSRYAGSQVQDNAPTIQGVLEGAITLTTGEQTRVAFAGRTDAGVHARGQVASWLTASRLPAAVIKRALNARLPADVVVRDARDVDLEFDPRRNALERHYRYLIDTREERSALAPLRAWHVPAPLAVDAMREAAAALVGVHDFAAFAGRLERPQASTVRDVRSFTLGYNAAYLQADITGNAFLPHQVRRMVGALVDVGRGRLTPAGYEALLGGPPASAGPTAPAHGLYLMAVRYAPELLPSSLCLREGAKGD
jgi:tRNA pseudouridine38-40 synthase